MTKKMKTKGTGKAMRMKEEIDSTVIPGIKLTRTIANLEKNAKDGTMWKTNRPGAIKKAVRSRYPIHNDIMESMFTVSFNSLMPCDIFTAADINSLPFMEGYVKQYRRSFGQTPLKLKGLDAHSKQLMMFDSDIEYFKTSFPGRSNRWLTIKLNKLVKQGILLRKKNHTKIRDSISGVIPINAPFYIFAKNPGFEWKTPKVGSPAEWVEIKNDAVLKAQEIIDNHDEKEQTVEKKKDIEEILEVSEKYTTTVSFMVEVFDIPLPVAIQIRPILGNSFAQYVKDGTAISKISPSQYMEIRDIINDTSMSEKERSTLAMQRLLEMLSDIRVESARMRAAKRRAPRTKKTVEVIEGEGRSTKHGHKTTAKKELADIVTNIHKAESIAKWFSNNSKGISVDPKLYAFLFIHAVEDGVIKW